LRLMMEIVKLDLINYCSNSLEAVTFKQHRA